MEKRESPTYVQTSLAGAICLGMERGRFLHNARCTCLNLLLTYEAGCAASCSYCGLAANREPDKAGTFIRVKWPAYMLEHILDRMRERHPFRRVCVSMVTRHQALEDAVAVIREVKGQTGLPVSALISPTVMRGIEDLTRIREAGADRVGIAVDAATPELFDRLRGKGANGPHRWETYWNCVKDAVQVFGPGMVGVHLIVGLGESEREMVEAIDRAHRMGALTHLFSFFPEAGSALEAASQPPLGQYRRIQLARYLINEGKITGSQISFGKCGQIVDFGIDVNPYVTEGVAFMTSGCPGENGMVACNRPFGNERASEPLRNYPFVPGAEDIARIRAQLWDGVRADA